MTDSQLVKNNLPKWLKYIILLFPFVTACFQLRSLDNDFYFLYPTGEYILKNGFPHTDFLSMHSDMKIVLQQWLSTVIFYLAYSRLGMIGLSIVLYICFAAICVLSYKTILLITKNEQVSAVLSAVTDILLFNPFIVTRPQIFTYVILLIEIWLLEKHAQTKKYKYLAGIPLLSVALVNLHASMWAMLFVFMLPFIAGAVPVKIRSFKLEANGSLIGLMAALAAGAAVGFLNPYGLENMIYLTSSYGQNKLSETIAEMRPADLSTHYGKMMIILAILLGMIGFFVKGKKFSVRYFCLFMGTLMLGLLHRKGISYFFIFGIISFSYVLKDVEVKFPEKLKSMITKRVEVFAAVILILVTAGVSAYNLMKSINEAPGKTAHYDRLDEVIEIMNKSAEPVVLYTNFNDGQYLEYKGFHPYIDGRAELFLLQNNEDYEYIGEYYDLRSAHMHYRDFTDRYMFNYLILGESSDRYLLESLMHDEDFELAYEEGGVLLFVRK